MRVIDSVGNFEGFEFGEAWFSLLNAIIILGDASAPRDQQTTELLGVRLHVKDMRNNILVHPRRNLSYRFMVAEWLWIEAGRRDVASIARYNKNISQFSDDGVAFTGAYGPRLDYQHDYLLNQLRAKPDTRQAVASIWTPNPVPSKDIPCTLTWQLLSREGKLHAIVNMRSSDIWLGLPYDLFNFSMMSMGLAGQLGLEPGSITFNLGSSHLYLRDREKALELLNDPEGLATYRSPRLPSWPPANIMMDTAERTTPLQMGDAAPWDAYVGVLRARTKAEALDLLNAIQVGNL